MTKILLVEDDKSLREIYGVRLLAEGYDIISAGDGEEALAMAIKDRPSLIVSDVMMPKISGFDMLDILRSTTETKNIKVIMMTALSSEDQRQRGVALGADRYLVKSQVGIEDVVRTVHEVLGDAPVSGQKPLMSARPSTPSASPAPGARPDSVTPPPRPAAGPGAVASAPAPAPSMTPPTSAATAPATELPQPTAPFSTPRTGTLADRVIQPISDPNANTGPDFGNLIEQELGNAPAPAPAPSPVPAPAPVAAPTPEVAAPPVAPPPAVAPSSEPPQPAAAPESTPLTPPAPDSGIQFEETPRPSVPVAPAPAPVQPPQPPQPPAPGA